MNCFKYYNQDECDLTLEKLGPLALRHRLDAIFARIYAGNIWSIETIELIKAIQGCEFVKYCGMQIGNNKKMNGPDSNARTHVFSKTNKKRGLCKRVDVVQCILKRNVYKDYCRALKLSITHDNAFPYVQPGTFESFQQRINQEIESSVDGKFTIFDEDGDVERPTHVQKQIEATFNVRDGKERFAVQCLAELGNTELRFVQAVDKDMDVFLDEQVKMFQALCTRVTQFWVDPHAGI